MSKATAGNAWMADLIFNAESTNDPVLELQLPLTLPWWFFTDSPNHIKPQIPLSLHFGADLTIIRCRAIIHT
jgi:hypothetical protein